MSTTLQNRLKTARRSIAHHANRLKKRKKASLSRKSTLCSIVDPATMLLKAALDQPAIECALSPVLYQTQTSIYMDDDDHDTLRKTTDLEQKLEDLQTCEMMIQTNGSELVDAVSRDLSGGTITKNTLDRLMLFKMTASAMVEASAGFTAAANKEHEKIKKKVDRQKEWFRTKKKDLNLDILKEAKTVNGVVRRTETDDDEYYDAIEDPLLDDTPSPSASLHSFSPAPTTPTKSLSLSNQRRTKVPHRPSNSINYLSLMKNCIGKDLSRISMPVDFNEPISVLQRQTEDLEYSHLLDQAFDEKNDQEKRLALVTAFAVSSYNTIGKRTAKPFNPLLGETFDFDRRDDFGWRAMAEQVSHHPPTCALVADSLKGWLLNQSYTYTSKVKGRSLCVNPIGGTFIKFPDKNDLFVYEKVCTATKMTNIMTGNLQTDNYGELTVKNLTSGGKCVVKFHEQGYFSKEEARKVSGAVLDPYGGIKYRLEGNWDKQLTVFKVDQEDNIMTEETVWKVNPPPKESEKMHNFTKFAVELNELEDGLLWTDSRLRPDQRLMEDGKWQSANEMKQKLEEAQRERRRIREVEGEEYAPKWFKIKNPDARIDKNDVYEFDPLYWKCRETQNFDHVPRIFDV